MFSWQETLGTFILGFICGCVFLVIYCVVVVGDDKYYDD